MRSEIFHGEVDIEYILRKPTNSSNVLVLSFPGAAGGMPGSWGYLQTINKLECNALFIKYDLNTGFGNSRLTCKNRDFIIERTIMEIVRKVKEETNSSHIIATGSSMGGWCALYYGLKYGYDVVSGSPPYLETEKEAILYAAGDVTSEDKRWLNSLLPNVIKEAGEKGYNGRVFLSWGNGERHWINQDEGPKMLKDLDSAGIKYKCQFLDFHEHMTVHTVFPGILENKIKILIGLEEETDEEIVSDEIRLTETIRNYFYDLLPMFDDLRNTEPDVHINSRLQYGSNDENIALRNYVYAMSGYFWYPGAKEPKKTGDSHNYWNKMTRGYVSTALTFVFPQSILNHYVYSGDKKAIEWCGDVLQQYLENIRGVASVCSTWYEEKDTVRRFHFVLNYHCLAEGVEGVYFDIPAIRTEIIECMYVAFRRLTSILDYERLYDKITMLLHTALYFRNNQEYFEKAYITGLELANLITNFHFDKNGVCIVQQSRMQVVLRRSIKKLLDFIENNDFPKNKLLQSFLRMYKKICDVNALLISPKGNMPAFGHSGYSEVPPEELERKSGIFIKPESNLAVINMEPAFISINSGTNIHANIKHCDLLSFQFCYDNAWLIADGEGGEDSMMDYAISSVAHSALLCDDKDYAQPNYIDWTTIDSFAESEDYAVINMSHRLFRGVELKRTLIWLNPNVIILFDTASGEEEHKYTQNFIMQNAQYSIKNNVTVKLGKVKMYIKQFSKGFELKEYYGTDNAEDLDNLRGSLITRFVRPRKGLNLAYNKHSQNAVFLTALEAHSSNEEIRKSELGIKKLRVEKPDGVASDRLTITFSNGTEKVIDLENAKKEQQ